ncbi:MAG: HD domain-containing protein [Anaeromicrobium sp.]|jgi:tRNA nucleotidyltransferase (CCA-adding enzyme)|uniref:CCA tRNA nucleotidyltransferase n=1 Tax=Anaeromicrobium sp. TaxID=1929132 RepID=UPI0025CF3A6F|nr:HD domain-containing protein [Anaeromicrobium sp.]MCT4593645.1 HD domain-containing protein [Anaeromicrobium sp.]
MAYKNKIPKDVEYIMKNLISKGYECFLVGGAVRDMILGLNPKDYDLCTNATPTEIENIFEKTIPTGKDYGTMTIMINNIAYEVTTYRFECDYDGRRPKVVKFTNTLKEDLKRRDFTINSMAMDMDGNIIDYFGGKKDLKKGIIRTVGNPLDRFAEDRLRMIRAIRFATRYAFKIDSKTYEHIHSNIDQISKERLRDELDKILLSEKPSIGIRILMEKGLWRSYKFNELYKSMGFNQENPHHDKDIFEHTMGVLDTIEAKLELRLSALFHDMGKPNTFTLDENNIGHFYGHHKESSIICKRIMTDLKYSNREIEHVCQLVYHHMKRYDKLKSSTVKKFIRKIGIHKLDDLFKLFIADRVNTKPPYDFEDIYRLKFACEKILCEKEPLSVGDLKINGKDLINMGLKQGKEIGIILNKLLELVLENPELNVKDRLLVEVKKMVEN